MCVGPGRRFAWRGLFLDVSEDLANEVGVGDVFDDAKSATAERAKGDVDVEDPFQSLCPGEGRGSRGGPEMKHKRYAEEQIIRLLKEHEAGSTIEALSRRPTCWNDVRPDRNTC